MKHLYKLLIFISFTIVLASCDDNENFSSDPNLSLSFSNDTIQFDSVFVSLASPFKTFKVYNRNNKSIAFESIKLSNSQNSGFRINVDGQAGTEFKDIELWKKDSTYIRIDIVSKPQSKTYLHVQDSICIKWNGNTKYILLDVTSINAHSWTNKVITKDSTITANQAFLVSGEVIINEGAKLNIEEGCNFYMQTDASIKVEGSLVANGNINKPISFRTHRFDNIQKNVPFNNTAGQWGGITIGENSYDNSFNNVRIRGPQKGLHFERASSITRKKATIKNTVVINSSEFGLQATNCDIDVSNSLFANARTNAVALHGGSYSFLHCTFANYYLWHPRAATTLAITNDSYLEALNPLVKCEIINTIVYGSAKNELTVSATEGIDFSFLFKNCIIKGKETENEYFNNVIWNTDPAFYNLNYSRDYAYSFELTEPSSAINHGDRASGQKEPLDIRGRSRLSSENPDVGCYEW